MESKRLKVSIDDRELDNCIWEKVIRNGYLKEYMKTYPIFTW